MCHSAPTRKPMRQDTWAREPRAKVRSGAGKSLMIGEPRSLFSNLDGWRMAGPGGFRRFSDGTIESYGGPGLLWYADEAFEDFLLLLEWRIARIEDNSGAFIRARPPSHRPDADILGRN